MVVVMFSFNEDPSSYEEAVKSNTWKRAMEREMKSIEDNDTWELITPQQGVKAIGVRLVFKTKYNEKGKVEKHKARLATKGYTQKCGIDYSEVFAPLARWDTIRIILALAAHKNWCAFQLDVKIAFLHGELNEECMWNIL